LAIVGFAWTLPQVATLLLGGVLADRFERRRVMIAADLIRAGAIGAVAALVLADAAELWHVGVLVALYGAGRASSSRPSPRSSRRSCRARSCCRPTPCAS
jgi:MFS family permease